MTPASQKLIDFGLARMLEDASGRMLEWHAAIHASRAAGDRGRKPSRRLV
jgi:hypothetical protein